jgi:hypothetical protein
LPVSNFITREQLGSAGGVLQVAHKERRKLTVKVGRNSSFETRGVSFVVAFDDMSDFVQPGNNARLVVGNRKFEEFSNGSQLAAQFPSKAGIPSPWVAEMTTPWG